MVLGTSALRKKLPVNPLPGDIVHLDNGNIYVFEGGVDHGWVKIGGSAEDVREEVHSAYPYSDDPPTDTHDSEEPIFEEECEWASPTVEKQSHDVTKGQIKVFGSAPEYISPPRTPATAREIPKEIGDPVEDEKVIFIPNRY